MTAVDLRYQEIAGGTDRIMSASLARLEAAGYPPEMLASGALQAVIRYHIKNMSCVMAERAILAILYPAVGACVASVLQAMKEEEAQAEADAHTKN